MKSLAAIHNLTAWSICLIAVDGKKTTIEPCGVVAEVRVHHGTAVLENLTFDGISFRVV